MRVNPTVTWVTREATVDLEFRGVHFPAGSILQVLSHSTGTDPRVMPQPGVDLATARERAPHLGFWSEGNERDLMVVEVALDAVGIRDLAPRSIHSLSSGERQMVLLAQAMAQEPEVLLLDEPTVHLDIRHQVRLFRLLKEWNETGNLTVLVISHDLNIAAQFCGRLVLMKDGRLEKDGKPREVITEENLKNVYGIQARVIANPATGSPAILFE